MCAECKLNFKSTSTGGKTTIRRYYSLRNFRKLKCLFMDRNPSAAKFDRVRKEELITTPHLPKSSSSAFENCKLNYLPPQQLPNNNTQHQALNHHLSLRNKGARRSALKITGKLFRFERNGSASALELRTDIEIPKNSFFFALI